MSRRAALLTPPGAGGIAVVRVTGEDLVGLLGDIFQTGQPIRSDAVQDTQLRFGLLCDGPDRIDQVVTAYNPAGSWVDINCHGGPRIIQRLFMLLQRHGTEICHWHELNQKATIEQEVRRHLPETTTILAGLALAGQYPAGLYQWCSEAIVHLQSDQWLMPRFREEMDGLLASWRQGQRLLRPGRAVLIGPPNAGKSSLANYLCGQDQSLVSELAGTTRDWTEHLSDINGIPVQIIDTAGRRDSTDRLEIEAIRLADRQISQADVVVLIVSGTEWDDGIIQEQMAVIAAGKPVIKVVSKIDLVSDFSVPNDFTAISTVRQTGIELLKQSIIRELGFEGFDPAAPLLFTERQCRLAEQARHAKNEYGAILMLYKLLGWSAG